MSARWLVHITIVVASSLACSTLDRGQPVQGQVTIGDFAPDGIATDAADDLLVADGGARRVVKFSPDGIATGTWSAHFSRSGPATVTADGGRGIYVSDPGAALIYHLSRDDRVLGTWPTSSEYLPLHTHAIASRDQRSSRSNGAENSSVAPTAPRARSGRSRPRAPVWRWTAAARCT